MHVARHHSRLWDKKERTIVSNESADILRMFNSAFDDLGAKGGDYHPKELRAEIDEVNSRIYAHLNNGVYEAGFAELRPPERPTFEALLALWPTWLSYAVSYLFIAIVWANHHYLMRYASEASPRLLWFNFAHLFSMSLLPLATAWMAVSELAPQPVAFYAAVFLLVNATYIGLIWELIDRTPGGKIPPKVRRIMRMRSLTTLCLFGAAAVVALKHPLVGLGICICCLIGYLRPEPPWAQKQRDGTEQK